MNWPLLAGGAFLLTALAAFLYWQLNLAEGVYLGRRIVICLYDRFAPRYDAVKCFDAQDEAWFLGAPLAQALRAVTTSLVLDVATGTGRVPGTLFQQPDFAGRVVGLDLSRQMLHRAAINNAAYQDRLTLLWQDASYLPFPDETFDAVTCIEALEFLPDSRVTLQEMARVLRPGGIFLVSNRIGAGRRWLPGRTMRRATFAALLESLSLVNVLINAWQVDYDIAWARKRSRGEDLGHDRSADAPVFTLPELLRCPHCASGPLTRRGRAFCCDICDRRYAIADDGVVELGY